VVKKNKNIPKGHQLITEIEGDPFLYACIYTYTYVAALYIYYIYIKLLL